MQEALCRKGVIASAVCRSLQRGRVDLHFLERALRLWETQTLFSQTHDEMNNRTNIILVGMPGSGKSTVGVILAKKLAMDFLDTDILIQKEAERTLQEIVDGEGHEALLVLEEQALLSISCQNHVIATGGSAVYSEPAMRHLKKIGTTVFLHADLAALHSRVWNYETRGIAKRPGQSLQDLFAERMALYEHYADVTVHSSQLNQDQVCEAIYAELQPLAGLVPQS